MTSKSLTYAQRMERTLRKSGISAYIERPGAEISERGCAYAVVVSEMYFAEAIEVLSYSNLPPVKAVVRDSSGGLRMLRI